MDKVSNQKLYDDKFKILGIFRKSFDANIFSYSFACNYHGISLKFHSRSEKLKQSLLSFLPEQWLNTENQAFEIYLLSPAYFNYPLESWCDEASQDCYSLEKNHIAIQRDFASWFISPNQILLICEDCVGDGFYNFLRWFISERLISHNKYVIHASCVLDKYNKAHIFLGHSGAGKTTITKLSAPRLTLGDDMNIISLEDQVPIVEAGAIGGLFNSMIGYDKKIEVKACYWLTQAKENSLVELSPQIANQKLLASFANLHWPTLPEKTADQLVDFSMKLTNTIKFYELQFKNDSSIWTLLD